MTASKNAMRVIRQNVMADSVSKDAMGNIVLRRGFYYRHGCDAEMYASQVAYQMNKLGIKAEVIDQGEVWKPFRGGASVSRQSHWWVKVRVEI